MVTRLRLADIWKTNERALLDRIEEPGIARQVQEYADRLTMTPAPPITLRADITIRDGHQRVLAAHLAGLEFIECVVIE